MSSPIGSFDAYCSAAFLPICPLVEQSTVPVCYSRNIAIADLLIFEPGKPHFNSSKATLIVYVVVIVMALIMIFNVKSKPSGNHVVLAAVSRNNFTRIPSSFRPNSNVDRHLSSAHTATLLSTFWALLFNGFVGFQWIEDGTPASLWSLRISSLLVFGIVYFVSIATFQGQFGLYPAQPLVLWIFYYVFSLACVLLFLVMQVILIVNTFEDIWPIILGFCIFALGQVIEYVLSKYVCDITKHYVDGLFFGTICSLISVMIIYKYWNSITRDDLEFSVGGKLNAWEIRDPLLTTEAMNVKMAS